MRHREFHRTERGSWLRAAVLGANDGIVSTASLVLGVAAADETPAAIAAAGIAGLMGGSLSMAAGEYVSVSSQRDVETRDLARERMELATEPERELAELTSIYEAKGLDRELAREVAAALMAKDALTVHAREELNIDVRHLARPIQAAASSALSFALGAALPLAAMMLSPAELRLGVTLSSAALALAFLGAWSARLGGTSVRPAVVRVIAGGLLAMGLTMGIGSLFGVAL
jgi:VIT1/CCC1 family predicted Fe2+/Mn2+ transporter